MTSIEIYKPVKATGAIQLMVTDTPGCYRVADRAEILGAAERLLFDLVRAGEGLASPGTVATYLRVYIGALPHEVFAVLYLDAQLRLIEREILFRGTLTQTAVYPREVVKQCLAHNAAAVILAHNHPSGEGMPSRADEHLTTMLKQALLLVDVRVLDHLVVTPDKVVSMAEHGLM